MPPRATNRGRAKAKKPTKRKTTRAKRVDMFAMFSVRTIDNGYFINIQTKTDMPDIEGEFAVQTTGEVTAALRRALNAKAPEPKPEET